MCHTSEMNPKVFYIPLPSGTSYVPMTDLGVSSGHPVIPLPHKLLSPGFLYQGELIKFIDGRSKMYKKLEEKNQWIAGWEHDRQFQFLSTVIGGWPRPQEYFLEELKNSGKVLENNDMQETLNKVIDRIKGRYKFDQLDDILEIILMKAITGNKIKRKACIYVSIIRIYIINDFKGKEQYDMVRC